MSLWHTGDETPPVNWDYPYDDYVSVRVIVEWEWENPENPKGQELRFATYWWKSKRWAIDGITGNTIIKRWFNPNDVK